MFKLIAVTAILLTSLHAGFAYADHYDDTTARAAADHATQLATTPPECPFGHIEECHTSDARIAMNQLRVDAARKALEIDYQYAGANPDAFHQAKIKQDEAALAAAVSRQ